MVTLCLPDYIQISMFFRTGYAFFFRDENCAGQTPLIWVGTSPFSTEKVDANSAES
jgi:hypothetical protein